MNKSATSKEKLLETAREIAYREGLGALNIRRVASESSIAIGTVYNYYPSKGDLIGAVMEDFWQNVFHGNDFDTQNGDFAASYREIYERLKRNLMKFRREFLDEMAAVKPADQKKGKELEAFYQEHIKAGMLSILNRDSRVDSQVWTDQFTKAAFVSFAFSNMILMLKEQQEPDYFEEIMRRLIYRSIQRADGAADDGSRMDENQRTIKDQEGG